MATGRVKCHQAKFLVSQLNKEWILCKAKCNITGKKTADPTEPRNDLKNSGRIMIGWLAILHEKLNAKI